MPISMSEKELETLLIRIVSRNTVRDQLMDKYYIKSIVSDKLNKDLPDLIGSRVDQLVPGHVSSEINKQLPNFLENSRQMQDILQRHSQNLNQKLESSARDTLIHIVDEDQYHQVNEIYFNAFRNRGDTEVNKMWTKCNHKLETFEQEIKNFHQHQDRTKKLVIENEKLKDKFNILAWITAGLGIGLATLCGIIILQD